MLSDSIDREKIPDLIRNIRIQKLKYASAIWDYHFRVVNYRAITFILRVE